MQPKTGFFAHGGSENNNHGPIRCACLDLATGEIVFDEDYKKKKRKEMEKGTACDAATISILSAIIWCYKRGYNKPIIYASDINAIRRVEGLLAWREAEMLPSEFSERSWHPMIVQAIAAINFKTHDVVLRRWDKEVNGVNPLAKGRYGK